MTSGRQPAPAVAALGVCALIAGALVPTLRPFVLLALAAGFAAAIRAPALRLPLAAALPAALLLVLRGLPPPVAGDLAWCADPLAPPFVWRGMEAVLTIGATLLLARTIGGGAAAIGLVRPGRRALTAGIVAAAAIGAGALVLGTTVAAPFFGSIALATGDPRSLLPAIGGALANGALEEVVFRGALLVWLTPALGVRGAIVAQALVFGAAHAGSDFTGSPLPVMAGVAAAGVVFGWVASVRRSLTLPIAVHAGFDLPLFYVAACRIG